MARAACPVYRTARAAEVATSCVPHTGGRLSTSAYPESPRSYAHDLSLVDEVVCSEQLAEELHEQMWRWMARECPKAIETEKTIADAFTEPHEMIASVSARFGDMRFHHAGGSPGGSSPVATTKKPCLLSQTRAAIEARIAALDSCLPALSYFHLPSLPAEVNETREGACSRARRSNCF